MANRFWVGGTGTWDSTSSWSASSGGASGASVPTSADDVFLDANSGGGTASMGGVGERECLSLDSSGYTGTLEVSRDLLVYGNLILGSGATYTENGGQINLNASTGSFSITSNGATLGATLDIGTGGSPNTPVYTLQDDLTSTKSLRFYRGTFDANGFDVTAVALWDVVTAENTVFTLQMGGGTWTLTSTTPLIDFDASVEVQKSTSNIVISEATSATKTYELGGLTWPEMTLPTGGAIHAFNDGGSIDSIIVEPGSTLTFESGNTFNLGDLDATGTSASNITINSSSAGSQHTLNTTGGNDITLNYVHIQDSNATGLRWFAGDNSTDSGNNNGWIFFSLRTYLANRNTRSVASTLQVSWKKAFDPTITLFTIGVSLIGGNDLIAPTQQQDSQWNKYQYFDETDYIQSLEWEQGLNIPTGGISQGLAAGVLDNTTGRYLPNYMGGSGEFFTSVLPRRPFIINAGFEDNGIDYTDPQFVGLFSRQPEIDVRGADMRFMGADFVNFLQNKYVDNTVMFTGQRSDQLIETVLQDLGYSTAQYDLDYGINRIPFAIFNKGERFSEIIHKITQAENAQFYQDEQGILKFENRQHWDSAPYNEVQYDIFTSQVLESKAPDDDHIINVVEINADIRRKQPEQTIFKLPIFASIEIEAGETISEFFQFEDPVLSLTEPTSGGELSYYKANTQSDGSGTDSTASITLTNRGTFAEAVKYDITNNGSTTLYLTQLVLSGRIAKKTETLYYRTSNDNSVTAYEEQPLVIDNDYIHEETWAQSYAKILLNDFAQPENLQEITIMAIPGLKLGDLISWQGRNWRVYNKRTKLNRDVGFIQELTLLQRTITSYFRVGLSVVGGSDKIAP